MGTSVIQRTFAGGELAPVMHSRADAAKYLSGLRTCRNVIVRRDGGLTNRAGLRFIDEAKTTSAGTRLVPYVGATVDKSCLLEFGNGYIRFYKAGALVRVSGVPAYSGATAYVPGDLVANGGTNYYCHTATTGNAPPNAAYWYALTEDILEIPTPYTLATLPAWSQSVNVLTLTHEDYAARELIELDVDRWVLRLVTYDPSIGPPTAITGAVGIGGTQTRKYVFSSGATETYEESYPSAAVTLSACGTPTQGQPHTFAFTVPAGVAEVYVYCDPYGNGSYGYIGTSTNGTFKDVGTVPDFTMGPLVVRTLFNGTGNYPSRSARYQQRRILAATKNDPDGVWLSRTGFPSNFTISSPLVDDDAITFRLAGNDCHPVRWIVATRSGAIMFTDGGEWPFSGGEGPRSPLSPLSIAADQDTYEGISPDVPPVLVGAFIVYLQARGHILRSTRYDQQSQSLAGDDLTLWASHLFDEHTFKAIALQKTPHSIVWCVRDDGVLLGLTFLPEQEVWGWHRHETDGVIEDCCVVPETTEDVLYLLVKRTIGGVVHRYIEKLESREVTAATYNAKAFFVDSGLSYDKTPAATAFSGLDHLEGKSVVGLADGVPVGPFTVSGGAVTLATAAKDVHLGLPIVYGDIETLDLDAQGSSVRDAKKTIKALSLLLDRSSFRFWAGPDADNLVPFDPQSWEGTAALNTGSFEMSSTSYWAKTGRVFIRIKDPVPFTLLGIIPKVTLGG